MIFKEEKSYTSEHLPIAPARAVSRSATQKPEIPALTDHMKFYFPAPQNTF